MSTYARAQEIYDLLVSAGILSAQGNPRRGVDEHDRAQGRSYCRSWFSDDDIPATVIDITVWAGDPEQMFGVDDTEVADDLQIARVAGDNWSLTVAMGQPDSDVPGDIVERVIDATGGDVLWARDVPEPMWFQSRYEKVAEVVAALTRAGFLVLDDDELEDSHGANAGLDVGQATEDERFARRRIRAALTGLAGVEVTAHILIDEAWAAEVVRRLDRHLPWNTYGAAIAGDGWAVRFVPSSGGELPPRDLDRLADSIGVVLGATYAELADGDSDPVGIHPFLGPEWTGLANALATLTDRLAEDRFWRMDLAAAAFGYDPYRSPFVQVLRKDGHFQVELIGHTDWAATTDPAQLAELRLLGWHLDDDPQPAETRRAWRLQPQSESTRAIADDLLEGLAVVFGTTASDYFIFDAEISDVVASLDGLERMDDHPIFRLIATASMSEVLEDPETSTPFASSVDTAEAPGEQLTEASALDFRVLFTNLAQHFAIHDHVDRSLLELVMNDEPLPIELEQARATLRNLTPRDLLTPAEVGRRNEFVEAIESALSELDDRYRNILVSRIVTERPRTLESVAAELGVTRERVRQLEVKLRSRIDLWLAPGGKLDIWAEAVRIRIFTISPLSVLQSALPEIAEPVPSLDLPVWFVIDKLDDGFESDGTWAAVPSLRVVADNAQRELKLFVDDFGVLDRSAVSNLGALEGFPREDIDAYLTHLGFTDWEGSWFAPTVRSIPDRAVAYLSVVGEPRSDVQIQGDVLADRALSSIKNALADDPRIARVDRNRFGLTAWGLVEYSGIRTEIEKRLRERGPIKLADLVEELTSLYDISPNSVITFASAWPFDTVRGYVILAWKAPVAEKSFAATRNLYRHPLGWAYRVTVTNEHLRGAGFIMPTALATHLELLPGTNRLLQGLGDGLSISYRGAQPAFGSIRGTLLDLDARGGESVVLFGGQDRVEIRKISPLPPQPQRAILALIGRDSGEADPREAIANALELPSEADFDDVATLSVRKEVDALAVVQRLRDDHA